MYKQLKKIFHQDESLAKEAYKTRFNSEYSCHINLQINGYEVFFVQTPDIFKKLLSIESQDKKTIKFIHELPDVAIEQIIKQYIIDEITSTNDIEGVYSSRKEITKILEDTPADDSSIRFLGLIKHY